MLESFTLLPNPWYRALVRACLHLLQIPERVVVEGPSSARVVVNKNDGGWFLHLIRLQQETGGILLEEDGTIDVSCVCRPPWPVLEVRDAVTRSAIDFEEESAGVIRFKVDDIECHTIIELRKKEL